MFVELEEVLDRSSTNVITVVVNFHDTVAWIDTSEAFTHRFQHSTVHDVERDARGH